MFPAVASGVQAVSDFPGKQVATLESSLVGFAFYMEIYPAAFLGTVGPGKASSLLRS